MENFIYYAPTKVIFGKGTEKRLTKEIQSLGKKRVFIVYGSKRLEENGMLFSMQRDLEQKGIDSMLFGGIKPNPLFAKAKEGVQKAIDFQADFILAVGGGSVIDSAKGIAHGAKNPTIDIEKFWRGEEKLKQSLPLGVILTISAAGSEMSNSSVLTTDSGKKMAIRTDFNRPVFAILNPEFTFTLPYEQIAYGIADIMMHTMERYFSKEKDNHLTDRIAKELLKNVIYYGKRAMADRKDYEAMSEIMWSSSLSHNGLTGLGRKLDFSVHMIAHEVGGRFDVPHGASLTALWGHWARYVYKKDVQRFAKFASDVFDARGTLEERARAGIRQIDEYFKNLKLPLNFPELNIGVLEDKVLEEMANSATKNDTQKVGIFYPLGTKEIVDIYQAANKS